MDKKESLELFKKGENAWNKWAESMLTERKVLESVGTWTRGDENQWNDETRSWHERAKADFSGYKFTSKVDFRNFHFPGDASYSLSAEFQRLRYALKMRNFITRQIFWSATFFLHYIVSQM